MAKEPETEGENPASNEALLQVYMSRLARRVREARRRAKLKQSELGELIGSNQSYIFVIEASKGNVTLRNLVNLAQALHVSPEDLLKPDKVLPVIDAERVRELSTLVHVSIQEVCSTSNNVAKVNEVLHQVYALLNEHSESLKAASIPES